jgi:hypothetical protein
MKDFLHPDEVILNHSIIVGDEGLIAKKGDTGTVIGSGDVVIPLLLMRNKTDSHQLMQTLDKNSFGNPQKGHQLFQLRQMTSKIIASKEGLNQ